MKKNTWLVISILLAAALAAIVFLFFRQKDQLDKTTSELETVTTEMEFQKQESLEEFEDLARQYENYYINTDNDSLLKLFDEEKQKVQDLLQELKTVKSTNARRISELKKELGTVRTVLQSYVVKVDSLNRVNGQLIAENEQVRKQYEEASENARIWEEKSIELDEKITLASMLEVGQINITALNSKGKQTTRLKRIERIEICFDLRRNITAERGLKQVFVRVTDPNGKLLESPRAEKFPFEGQNLGFTCKKEVEYNGENTPVCMYYTLPEAPSEGIYTITIFAEGNILGERNFSFQ
ncbi:MAG: hypothetical protein J5808_04070 [Paludibacteraceae bacterium]|nr:hypothetical protein [Paludibacteraceae bacterium]